MIFMLVRSSIALEFLQQSKQRNRVFVKVKTIADRTNDERMARDANIEIKIYDALGVNANEECDSIGVAHFILKFIFVQMANSRRARRFRFSYKNIIFSLSQSVYARMSLNSIWCCDASAIYEHEANKPKWNLIFDFDLSLKGERTVFFGSRKEF